MEKEVAHRQRLKIPPRIEQSAGILKHEMIIKMEMKYINHGNVVVNNSRVIFCHMRILRGSMKT